MAITRAQQARQMLKDGNFVMQGGVRNYLGKQKTVSDVPVKWQSGPDKPSTELAYITKAEKDLLLKKDIHGSLKDGPNKGPEGIISLDSAGDKDGPVGGFSGADVSAAERGETPSGMSQKQADEFRGGAIAAGARARDDDTARAKEEAEKIKKQVEKRKREARRAITKEEKIEARRNYKKIQQRLRADKLRRQSKLQAILGGKQTYNTFKYNPKTRKYEIDETVDLPGQGELQEDGTITGANPFGINEKEYQDLISSLPSYDGPPESPEQRQERINNYLAKNRVTTDLSDPLNQLFETNDRFSGVNLEAFQNEFNMPKTGITSLDMALGFASPFLKAGTKKTKEFFSGTEDGLGKNIFGKPRKSVLEAGKYTYDGLPIDPTTFAMLDPALMDDVYKDYMGRRMSGEIDAYGNPTPPTKDDESDPCLGPNPPAYCFTRNEDPTPTAPPVFTPAFRFMNRGGMVEDAPMGGIMDLETTRQMLFIGGIAKGISKGLKSVTRGLKKVAKSPLGKAALLGAVGFGIPGTSFGGLFGRASFGKPALGAFGKFGIGPTLFANPTIAAMKTQGLEKGFFPKFFENMTGLKVAGLSGLAGALLANVGKDDDDGFNIEEYYKMAGIDIPENQYRFLAEGGSEDLSKDPNYKGWVKLYEKNPDAAAMNDKHKEYLTFYQREQNKQAEGSREPVAKKTMPLLDLEGQEMDFRAEGGFVPIGRMEKADDVPARLSKNEFVFTADAVRNAGGGDVDKGAEVMYNTMKNLEAGGEVSEETQGLEGARKMFQTSQRLGEVI